MLVAGILAFVLIDSGDDGDGGSSSSSDGAQAVVDRGDASGDGGGNNGADGKTSGKGAKNSGEGAGDGPSRDDGDGASDDGAPEVELGNSAFDGPEGRAGAETVEDVNESIEGAVDEGIVPLDVDPRQALAVAQRSKLLTQACDMLSTDAKAETVQWVKELVRYDDVEWTCEKAMWVLIRNSKVNRALKASLNAEVIGVNVVGDTATATLDFGEGRPTGSVSLVKENGEWKIGSPPGR